MRKTYNRPAREVAWQKQLRDLYATPPPPIRLDISKAVVSPIDRVIAKPIILQYEWLGTMSYTRYHFGIFFDGYCAGVTCVARGVGTGGAGAWKEWGIGPYEFLILSRGACTSWAPPNTNSKLVSWTAKLLKRSTPGKLIIAYADEDAGEIGTIYQACNWKYVGLTGKLIQLVSPEGRVLDQRNVGHRSKREGVTWREAKDRYIADGYVLQQASRKHKYVTILNSDPVVEWKVSVKEEPYPKRKNWNPEQAEKSVLNEDRTWQNLIPGMESSFAAMG